MNEVLRRVFWRSASRTGIALSGAMAVFFGAIGWWLAAIVQLGLMAGWTVIWQKVRS